jgi:hypothetical protein
MPLDAAELLEIETLLSTANDSSQVVAGMRHRFPSLTITRCDASDVDTETPVLTVDRFSVFLVDGSDHCWRLTTDAARATGLVLVTT